MIEIDVPKAENIVYRKVEGLPDKRKVPYFTIIFSREHAIEPIDLPGLLLGMRNDEYAAYQDPETGFWDFMDLGFYKFMRVVELDFSTTAIFDLHSVRDPSDVGKDSVGFYSKRLVRYGDLIERPVSEDQISGLDKLREAKDLCVERAEILTPFWSLLTKFENFQETRNISFIKDSLEHLSEASMQTLSKQRYLELQGAKMPKAKKRQPTKLEIWMWATATNVSEFAKKLTEDDIQKTSHFKALSDPLNVLLLAKLAADGTIRNPQDGTYDFILWLFADIMYRTAYGVPLATEIDYKFKE